MIYLTGDRHGVFFDIPFFVSKNKTTTDDILILLGDVGFNYYNNSKDNLKKKKMSFQKITLFCIHGNHEMRPSTIPTYKTKEFAGGIVWYEKNYPNILFAKDGEVYNFEVNGELKKFIVIGGAYTVNKDEVLKNRGKWFSDEQPSQETKLEVEKKLSELNWKIDYVLTHTAPKKYEPTEWFLNYIDHSKVDYSTEIWLDLIEDRLTYDKWYCSHYHGEKKRDRIEFLYQSIKTINGDLAY